MLEQPNPRLGRHGPAILGVAGLVTAIAVFIVVLIFNPFHSKALPAPAPSDLPKSWRLAAPGDCLENRGDDKEPVLIVVACKPGVYEVLERIDGTIDTNKCDEIKDSTYHYFYDSELPDSFDFVLCMKKRP